MRALMLYFIVGMLWVGFGYQHCPGKSPLTSNHYGMNVVLWPLALAQMILDGDVACR